MKAAIYARVSTDDQDLDHQLNPLRDYCRRQGYEIALEESDVLSGRDSRREGMNRVIREARARRVQVVVVAKLDRWGRSATHCVESIRQMRARGTRFVAVDQGLTLIPDTGGMEAATSDLLLRVMGAVAEFEAALISERTKAGIKRAMDEGRHGRPPKPCLDCGSARPRGAGAAWGKRHGRRVPLCGPCKGSRKGGQDAQEEKPPKTGGSENGRFPTPETRT